MVARAEREVVPFRPLPDTHMQCSFGHLDGYSAIYYTYLWSQVIAKDFFSQFDRERMLDPVVPGRYRGRCSSRADRSPPRSSCATS